jgi:hypothetical protein
MKPHVWIRSAAIAAVSCSAAVAPAIGAATAEAHRSGCHGAHSCPSDHATYRWHGMLCVSPASGESRSGYPKKVRYGGRVYYCKR